MCFFHGVGEIKTDRTGRRMKSNSRDGRTRTERKKIQRKEKTIYKIRVVYRDLVHRLQDQRKEKTGNPQIGPAVSQRQERDYSVRSFSKHTLL